jgi:hypothetical protein
LRFDKKSGVMVQSESYERKWVWLLCGLAAIHVFIFSAAFPFFNNVDEDAHFDLVVKYAQGDIPRSLGPAAAESVRYMALYHSFAYLEKPSDFPGGHFPPPVWEVPAKEAGPLLLDRETVRRYGINHEDSQPPLYYALAGLWWHIGQWCGLENGRLLYWLRFLNILIVVALVCLGYAAAQMLFPEQLFLRLGVPALLAFIPQTVFYSIENDVLSPLCFGAAFICLIKLLRAETPGVRLGTATGLALAATFLTKMSNLPLLALSAAVILLKILRLAKTEKWRAALPALTALALCAALPIGSWIAWCKYNFGDLTGSTPKIAFLGWTRKPFAEWWHHPIFTPHGLWTFLSGLLATFWQGEFWWHGRPLPLPAMNLIYVIASLFLPALAAVSLCPRFANTTESRREALCLCFMSLIASVAFLAFISIIYDFHNCANPSRAHPYFTSGRLLLGALIPFLLIFVYGIDRALKKFGDRVKSLVLGAMILFMLTSEIIVDWPVFSNEYNWFHLK